MRDRPPVPGYGHGLAALDFAEEFREACLGFGSLYSPHCIDSCGHSTQPILPERPYCSGSGGCSHAPVVLTSIRVTHFTHSNPRFPGTTRRTGAP